KRPRSGRRGTPTRSVGARFGRGSASAGAIGGRIAVMLTCLLVATVVIGAGPAEAPRMRVEAGHPWRPPFGLDRVGRPAEAVVEFPAARPAVASSIVSLLGGKEVGRQRVRPPGPARITLDGDPDEVVLVAGPNGGREPRELARAAVPRPEIEAEAIA